MKQVILVRKDLKMPKGKISVQVSHASVEATLKSDREIIRKWNEEGMKKVVLKVDSKEELLKYREKADNANLVIALVTDAAKTFFKKPELTCLAIGPDKDEKIDKITGKLKLLE